MGWFSTNDIEKHSLVKELRSRVADLEASNGKLLSKIESDKDTIETFADVKQGYEKRITELAMKHSTELATTKAELEAMKLSVNRKVNKALANIGVNNFAPEEITQSGTMNAKDIYEKWKSLKGYEKGKYFKLHEQVINSFNKERQI